MTITTKEKILEKVFQKNPDFHFWPLAGQLFGQWPATGRPADF